MAFVPQNFKDQVGPAVSADWLNGVDVTVYSVLGGATTVSQALAALGLPVGGLATPVSSAQGGTGSINGVGLIINGGADTGVVNAYVVSVPLGSMGSPAALVSGQLLSFIAANQNTGPSTINVGGTGLVSIIGENGGALTGGELSAVAVNTLRYNGVSWQIINQSAPVAATAAEIAQGIIPISTQYAPNNVFRFMTAAQIADVQARTFVLDVTTAVNNALQVGRTGSTIRAPQGGYHINGTLVQYSGQIIQGDGWATVTGSYAIASGTEFRQYNSGNIALMSCQGTSDAAQNENAQLRDLALTNSTLGGTGFGYYNTFARKATLSNVYISSFAVGMNFVNTSWLVRIDHCTVMDFTQNGLVMGLACEDSLVTNSQFSGYYLQSVPLHLVGESSNNTFINCYFQGCNFAVQMDQQDNGAGVVYPMGARFYGCFTEDVCCAVFALNSTLNNPALPIGSAGNKGHPSLLVDGLRAYNSGNFVHTAGVTGASGTGTTATLTFPAVGAADVIPVGSQINVSGMTPAGYNASNAVVTASSITSVSYASAATGAMTVAGNVFSGAIQNHGQSIVYAQFASQITVRHTAYAVGFSYATTITGTAIGSGSGYYGYFYNNAGAAPVGPIVWEQDNNTAYGANGANNGNARFRGTTGAITQIPGNTSIGNWTNASSIAFVGGNTTLIPFQTVVSDFGQWVSTTHSGCVIPLRNQITQFTTQVYTASAPVGQYQLLLYKNGSLLAVLASETVSTAAQPLALVGSFYDTPNGSTDYYQIFINSNVSFTIDNAASHTWFVAAVAGT